MVDDITADIILGIDFLKAENCIVDLGHKTLELPARKTLLKLQTEGQHDKGMCGMSHVLPQLMSRPTVRKRYN